MSGPPASVLVPRTQVLADWITSLGWDGRQETGYAIFPGPEIIDAPDRALFVTPAPGPGYATEEGSADAWAFQARIRGPADDPLAPELAAQQLDWLILHAPLPSAAGGVAVLAAHRLGSTPVPLPLDPGSRRFEFTCTYVLVTGE